MDGLKAWLWAHWKALIGIFISSLAIKSGGILGKLLGSMGLTYVTYTYVMPEIKAQIEPYLNGLPKDVFNLVTYCQVDKGMVLLLSAMATRVASNFFFAPKESG